MARQRSKSQDVRTATWNVSSMVSRSGEVVDALHRRKIDFWDSFIIVLSGIPKQEIIFIGSDMNGHVGDGYGGVHSGMGFGTRNAEGERILEFGDAVGMVVCNTFFKKEDTNLITYQSGDNRSMIDYLMFRKTDRCLVKDVKVISSEECVPEHRMVIGR